MVLIYDVAYKIIRKCDKTRFYDKTKTSIISFK